MDTGAEAIADAQALGAVKRQACRVQWKSAIAALLLTALYVVFS